MGAAGFKKGFIHTSDDVLHHTKLLDMSKEEVPEFTLPNRVDSPLRLLLPRPRHPHVRRIEGEVTTKPPLTKVRWGGC